MYMCPYFCMHACVCLCMFVHRFVCIHLSHDDLLIVKDTCMCIGTWLQECAFMYLCVHVCRYVHVRSIYIHACIHAYICVHKSMSTRARVKWRILRHEACSGWPFSSTTVTMHLFKLPQSNMLPPNERKNWAGMQTLFGLNWASMQTLFGLNWASMQTLFGLKHRIFWSLKFVSVTFILRPTITFFLSPSCKADIVRFETPLKLLKSCCFCRLQVASYDYWEPCQWDEVSLCMYACMCVCVYTSYDYWEPCQWNEVNLVVSVCMHVCVYVCMYASYDYWEPCQ
jgi:hypothetical protein